MSQIHTGHGIQKINMKLIFTIHPILFHGLSIFRKKRKKGQFLNPTSLGSYKRTYIGTNESNIMRMTKYKTILKKL